MPLGNSAPAPLGFCVSADSKGVTAQLSVSADSKGLTDARYWTKPGETRCLSVSADSKGVNDCLKVGRFAGLESWETLWGTPG